MGIFTSGGEDSKYSTTQRKISFPLSTLASAFGSAGFLLSSLLYYGVVEMTVVIPETHNVGILGSTVLMFSSLFLATWTLDAMPITFFGWFEWVIVGVQVIWLLAPILDLGLWSSFPVLAPLNGVVVGVLFWFVCVRGVWDGFVRGSS